MPWDGRMVDAFWVLGSGFGFWVLGSGFWVLCSGFWVSGSIWCCPFIYLFADIAISSRPLGAPELHIHDKRACCVKTNETLVTVL